MKRLAVGAVLAAALIVGLFAHFPGDRWLKDCLGDPTCATDVGVSDPYATLNP